MDYGTNIFFVGVDKSVIKCLATPVSKNEKKNEKKLKRIFKKFLFFSILSAPLWCFRARRKNFLFLRTPNSYICIPPLSVSSQKKVDN